MVAGFAGATVLLRRSWRAKTGDVAARRGGWALMAAVLVLSAVLAGGARIATAALLVAAALAHLALRQGSAGDTMGWGVDLALLATAGVLVLAQRKLPAG